MQTLLIIGTGIFGLIVGSFLNVIILRMNTGKGIGGRSQCFSCNKALSWYELIPVVSYLFQKGKCNHCKSKISKQYALVELSTALLFIGIAITHNILLQPITFIIILALVSTGIIIAVYDIFHNIIPEKALLVFLVLATILGAHGWGFIIVPIPFLILWLVSNGKWIGFGDVELMACMGMLLGVVAGVASVVFAFWIATIIIIPWFILQKFRNKKIRHEIPFGPFLLISMYAVYLVRFEITTLIMSMVK